MKTRRSRLGPTALYAILLASAAIYLSPIYVLFVNSIKPLAEIHAGSIMTWPEAGTLAPWRAAWSEAQTGLDHNGLSPFFLNSIIITVPAVILTTALGALNGYVLCKWPFRGDRIVFALILFSAFIPFQIVLLPMAAVLGALGLAGSSAGLVLVHVVYGLGLATVFFRGAFNAFPNEVVRAATIDGAGFFAILIRVLLPSSLPIIAATVIWQFTHVWNDYLFGLTFSSAGGQPVTVALNNLVSISHGVREYNVYFAAALQTSLPTLIVYILFGRWFLRGALFTTPGWVASK
ncbi:MAG: carbohydrate ABC transporter permease [Alphaproteobacteria bacterium]|nr:carbohydrate ABC transporter permease [Alphaproteobacteria bacterium]